MTTRPLTNRKCMTATLLCSTATLGLILGSGGALAQTNWTGATSTNWFTGTNWTGGVPDPTDEVIINTQSPNPTVIALPGALGDDVFVGNGANATLTVNGTGTLTSETLAINDGATGLGIVNVTGPNASIRANTNFNTAQTGDGNLNITAGGTVSSDQVSFAGSPGATSVSVVDGAGSELRKTNATDTRLFDIGQDGDATLTIRNGGFGVSEGSTAVGNLGTATGRLIIEDDGSIFRAERGITVGNVGTGTVIIRNQGRLESNSAVIGAFDNPTAGGTFFPGIGDGTVEITGAGSNWFNSTTTNNAAVAIGAEATGQVRVLDGGRYTNNGQVQMGTFASGTGTMTVDGTNSAALFSRATFIGLEGTGTINVTNGGALATGQATTSDFERVVLGDEAGATGTINVDGADSFWGSALDVIVGDAGEGTINVTNGGDFSFSDDLDLGVEAGSMGTVTVSGANSLIEQVVDNAILHRFGDDGSAEFNVLDGASASFSVRYSWVTRLTAPRPSRSMERALRSPSAMDWSLTKAPPVSR